MTKQTTKGNEHGLVYSYDREKPADLDVVPIDHKGRKLSVAKFDNHEYRIGASPMYSCWRLPLVYPMEGAFRPATTSESISASYPDFKEQTADTALKIGQYVIDESGIYLNPCDENSKIKGYSTWDIAVSEYDWKRGEVLKVLRGLRDKAKKVNGIYLGDNDFAFVPGELLRDGLIEPREFAESGLARGLEHVEENWAPKLEEIASKYSRVKVRGLVCSDKSSGGIDTITLFESRRPYTNFISDLAIQGNSEFGFAFGVLKDKAQK